MPPVSITPEELLRITGDDPFVRLGARLGLDGAWRGEDAVAFLSVGGEEYTGRLAVLGPPEAAAALLAAIELPDGTETTVPRGTPLPAPLRFERAGHWDFRSTLTPPPLQPHEERGEWLGEESHPELIELLKEANPGTSVWPGEAAAARWAGVRDEHGRIVACLADTSGPAGSPAHLSAIGAHPDVRGLGYGPSVTAWATRALLAEGRPAVTLGLWASNDVARRMYDRLGFADDRPFTSGPLVRDAR
ncbi:GNAT family N-acetyltransferase [Bailinhaonella thermotolerans]|uniref:N-acetyltransferase n=1 Tax=Bailinhaonella thermotolerans TaxID=1070861 RepID=A0A3A4BRM3_9ACTN|nr:GNAT family N-acetyltransferase [Bailinhaonella thermotolerans]RJL33976.1 N-acetyltransferase [Bailinhaonella thermotolerans]